MKGKAARRGRQPAPCARYKHACAVCRGFVYLHGGRNASTLRDFWRYDIVRNEWEMLDCSRDGPEPLEEHSMVAYKGTLYIFGGMVDSAFTQAKTPLWIYDTGCWVCFTLGYQHGDACCYNRDPQSSAPTNRRGHSAVVYGASMYIYGGYCGIRGISQEFWTFHFDTRKWLCVSTPSHSTGPGPRHGHSAVVYHAAMYLFGGLMGLSEQKDLWKWDFVNSSWYNIRTSQGPSPVVGHASVVFKDSMLVFGGGISNSSPSGDLWKYHFHTQTWKKLSSVTKANFSPKMYHCMLGIGAGFQTTSDFVNTFSSRWKNKQEERPRPVTVPQHSRCCSSFRPQPLGRALRTEESGAIEMKTFSLPLEPAGFCAFQTTSEVELDPKRAASILPKDQSAPLLVPSEKETAAAVCGEREEGAGCQHAAAVDGANSAANVLLLIGGKPLSSFSEISFWQIGFDSLSSI